MESATGVNCLLIAVNHAICRISHALDRSFLPNAILAKHTITHFSRIESYNPSGKDSSLKSAFQVGNAGCKHFLSFILLKERISIVSFESLAHKNFDSVRSV